MDNEKQNSLADKPRRVAQLTLVFDLETLVLEISGSVPNNAVVLDIARRLLDEAQWRAHQDWLANQSPKLVNPGAHWPARYGRG